MKKALSAILTAAALLTSAAADVFAADTASDSFALKYTVNGKEVTVTGCTGSTDVLKIPSEIKGLPVTAVAENAFSGNADITACILPDSIKTVGAKAFSTCPVLNSITVGKNVSFIGDYAFTACPELASFTVDKDNPTYTAVSSCLYSRSGDTLFVYAGGSNAVVPDRTKAVGKGAFFGRADITSVSLPETVTAIGDNAFSGCLSLNRITIPDSVTKLGKGCFMSCSSLESVSLGGALAAIPENCFHSCNSLKNVSISGGITSVGDNAFYSCTGLGSIYIPSSVTSVGKDAVGRRYDVRSSSSENISGFVITGIKGSAAEKYASEYGIDFREFKVKKGDINGDGFTDAVDASAVLAEYARMSSDKSPSFTSEQKQAADWNGDGFTDAVDASGILAEYARLSSERSA